MYVCKCCMYVFSLVECIYPPCMYESVICLDLFLSIGFFASLYAALPIHNVINVLKVSIYVCMYAYMFVCTYESECMYVCILVSGIYKLETATGK